MSAPLARYVARRGDPLKVAVAAVVVCGAYYLLRGGRELNVPVLAMVLGGGLVLGLATARAELAVGRRWLSQRAMVGRRRWVRTDQIVRVDDEVSGVDRSLTLHDRDGRRAMVMASQLRRAPELRAQLVRDLATSQAAGLDLPLATRERLGLP